MVFLSANAITAGAGQENIASELDYLRINDVDCSIRINYFRSLTTRIIHLDDDIDKDEKKENKKRKEKGKWGNRKF